MVDDDGPQMSSFAELLLCVRQGDPAAAQRLFEQYQDAIRRVIRFTMLDRRLKRMVDVCQSVLMRFLVNLWAGRYELERPEDLVNLLKVIVRHRVADLHRYWQAQRRDVRRTQSEGLAAASSSEGTPSELVVNAELLREADRLLAPDERLIFDLRRQGIGWNEIAVRLDSHDSPDTIRKRHERAVKRIERQLGFEE